MLFCYLESPLLARKFIPYFLIFLRTELSLPYHLQEMLNLREGTLLEGTVKKIFPYGAQVRIGETNRR